MLGQGVDLAESVDPCFGSPLHPSGGPFGYGGREIGCCYRQPWSVGDDLVDLRSWCTERTRDNSLGRSGFLRRAAHARIPRT